MRRRQASLCLLLLAPLLMAFGLSGGSGISGGFSGTRTDPLAGWTEVSSATSVNTLPAAPTPPAAGGTFADPTYSSTILRVTDSTDAPLSGGVNETNSAARDSQFNADETLFYARYDADDGGGVKAWIYSVDVGARSVSRLGALPVSACGGNITWDGAPWHPSDRLKLYGIVTSDQGSKFLCEITITESPFSTDASVVHNFSDDIPNGGYPSSRVHVHPDGDKFFITASTTGGQDTYNYVVIWDDTASQATTYVTTTEIGAGKVLHAMDLDDSGAYVVMEVAGTDEEVVWDWGADATSSDASIEGHFVLGNGVAYAPDGAGGWERHDLDDPTTAVAEFTEPQVSGKVNFHASSHSSNAYARSGGTCWVRSLFVAGDILTWVLDSGSVYRSDGYLAGVSDRIAPTGVRFDGELLTDNGATPDAAGEWWFDVSGDDVYVWAPGGEDLTVGANAVDTYVFNWRPLEEEVIEFCEFSGTWYVRRLAHHRQIYDGSFGETVRANVSPDGSMVLFQSRMGSTTARKDFYLLFSP